MADWLTVLQNQVAATSCQAVADVLGYSRPAVSLAVNGKYPGKTDKLAARVLDVFSRVRCPYSGHMVSPTHCRTKTTEMPTSSPGAVRWWKTCQQCEHKPQMEDNHDQSGNSQ